MRVCGNLLEFGGRVLGRLTRKLGRLPGLSKMSGKSDLVVGRRNGPT